MTKPIAKEEGISSCTIDRTRPISLTPVLRRLFEKIILRCMLLKPHPELTNKERLRGYIGIGRLNCIQGGFRSGHSTSLHLLSLQEWYCKGRSLQAFIDVMAAFDSVDQDITLARFKCRLPPEGQILHLLMRSMFLRTMFCAIINGEWTIPIDRCKGLLQGSLLAPLLFDVYIDPLALILQPSPPSDTVPLRALLIADDIALLGRDRAETQHLLTLTVNWLSANGLRCNHNKCGVIGNVAGPELQLGGVTIPNKHSYTYLGVPVGVGGIDFEAYCNKVHGKARRFFDVCVPLSIQNNWSEVCRLNVFKVFILSRYQYCGALLRAWLNGCGLASPGQCQNDSQPTLQTLSPGASQLSQLSDMATCWILKLPPTTTPRGPGGLPVLRSIAGLPSFVDRLDELTCFFHDHIANSDKDNPIRSVLVPCPPWPAIMLLPRINAIPLVKHWVAIKPALVRQQQALAASRALNGQPALPIKVPLVKTFILKTRQDRLDQRGRLHLAARILTRARKDIGSYDRVLKIRSPEVRSVLIRWRRGVWGVGSRCPTCNEPFRTSHVARCKLLQDEWGQCAFDTFGDIHDLRSRGVVGDAISGYGFIDMCLNRGEFGDAVKMLKDLCKKLVGVRDWTGVYVAPLARPGAPR